MNNGLKVSKMNVDVSLTLYQGTYIFRLKTFADDKIDVAEKIKFVLEMVENIVDKKEKMLVARIFSFSHIVFQRILCQGCLNSEWCGKGLIKVRHV